jgi:hypothetical protein
MGMFAATEFVLPWRAAITAADSATLLQIEAVRPLGRQALSSAIACRDDADAAGRSYRGQQRSLRGGSQRSELAGADQRTSQVEEGREDVGTALAAKGEAPVGQQPSQRPLHLPAVAAQPPVGLHPTPGDPRRDIPTAQHPPAGPEVVALIRVQLGRPLARPTRPAPWPDDRRDRVHDLFEQQRVVGVGGRQPDRQRQAAAVDQQVVLGAGLAPVDRVRANQLPPRRARTLAESMAARDQSTWSSSPSQSSSR